MAFMHHEHGGSLARFLVASLFGAALLLAPASAYAAETPSIAYDGNARQLTVSGVEAPSGGVDLFPAFKDLIPGDTREQPIKIEAKGVQGQVSIFVRAVVDEDTARALEPISLTAAVSTGPSSSVLETGTPASVFAETAKVATFAADGNATLDLRLSVPTSVGNELADASKTVRWEITAEDDSGELDAIPARPEPARKSIFSQLTQTGDSIALGALVAVLIIAAIGIALAVWRRNKR
ncbi:MAG: hypothetical protein UD025_09215 [Senegalimassilia anaerobia]|uniref:hypothetical protein n=1 Tax=Senegalimassilia anaerobia TaxID=1473216 RepID=UPI002E7AA55E|nr:hypothetical protein [Senegalimassilia anaerobia]MEE0304475.1 hypothetical protein [Senegalimassilia anaerobia]